MNVKKVVTVVIPTLNNINGLAYLLNYFKEKSYDVVIVDNQPNEEKKEVIIGLDPRLRGDDNGGRGDDNGGRGDDNKNKIIYLPQEKNLGFAIAVNRGAKDVKTKWMLILNDDIVFQDQISNIKDQNDKSKIKNNKSSIIEELIKYAEEDNLDAVSPILRNPDGKVENYGYKLLSIGKIQLIKEIPRSKSQDPNKSKILNTKYEILDTDIDGITAACLLVKTEVFKKLGGFDEKFFAYLEDVDFFLRMKKMDPRLRGDDNGRPGNDNEGRGDDRLTFGIAYDVEVLHNHMTTTKTMGNFKARQDMINWWRLFFKHPEKFKFNLDFIMERLRNVSGFIKASLK